MAGILIQEEFNFMMTGFKEVNFCLKEVFNEPERAR